MSRRPERFGDLLPGVLADMAARHIPNGEPPMDETPDRADLDALVESAKAWAAEWADPHGPSYAAARRLFDAVKHLEGAW